MTTRRRELLGLVALVALVAVILAGAVAAITTLAVNTVAPLGSVGSAGTLSLARPGVPVRPSERDLTRSTSVSYVPAGDDRPVQKGDHAPVSARIDKTGQRSG